MTALYSFSHQVVLSSVLPPVLPFSLPTSSCSEVIVPIKLGHDGGAIGLRDDDNAGAVVVQRMPVFDAPFGLRFLVTVFQALLDFAIRDRAP